MKITLVTWWVMDFALTETVRTGCQKANSVSALPLLEADVIPLELPTNDLTSLHLGSPSRLLTQ
jgi:hypothetical protein